MSNIDLDYFSSSVTDTDKPSKDVDINNISILREQLTETDRLLALHNTFDVIDTNSKYTTDEQMIGHRIFVTYMRSFREDLAKKVEELGNGW